MVFVIAELGSNHNGDIGLAKKLINEAHSCGASAVKLQAFDQSIWTPEAWKARERFAIDQKFAAECASHAEMLGIEFMCTPCYEGAVEWLEPLVTRWKIASSDIKNQGLVNRVRLTNKPVLASTGFLAPGEVWPLAEWATPMHCVPAYPARAQDYAIRSWLELAFPFSNMPWSRSWGISDHSEGIGAAVAAVAHGAYYVEKHFALYNQPQTPDSGSHAARPAQFHALVQACSQAHKAVRGSLVKASTPKGRKVW